MRDDKIKAFRTRRNDRFEAQGTVDMLYNGDGLTRLIGFVRRRRSFSASGGEVDTRSGGGITRHTLTARAWYIACEYSISLRAVPSGLTPRTTRRHAYTFIRRTARIEAVLIRITRFVAGVTGRTARTPKSGQTPCKAQHER